MKSLPRPAVIALDVGGVLYHDEPFELAWLQEVLERTRLPLPEFERRMRAFYLSPNTHRTVFSPAGTASWTLVRSRWHTLVQPIPGALAAVGILSSRYELCVIANQPPECRDALHNLGLAQSMRVIALDSLVGHAKPDLVLFAWTLRRLGCRPEDLLMVGDRPDQDAAPALALGCRAAIVQHGDSWQAPAGTHPQLLEAYRRLLPERAVLNSPTIPKPWLTFPDLPSLAGALASDLPAPRGAAAT
ncbi:HAD family hydrolase [Sphaerimonospora thailandensis]|uniref:HAD family hydrolase n=1 Tax=Sphaerimonospora thailandensis TaxID=795644 RepID=A0A8J3R6B9_9ACTN|nr:HAD family hydrolase [Sphaerimonospora thailandensis]GIH68789.1 hypothetical protein Mth01_10420 [Sphaerimonospora thailandensis]